jgi:hypothetical protein
MTAAASTLTYEDMIKAESQGMTFLSWKLMKPTAFSALECLASMGLVCTDDQLSDGRKIDNAKLSKTTRDAFELCEFAIVEYDIANNLKPSEIATACMIAARKANNFTLPTPSTFDQLI